MSLKDRTKKRLRWFVIGLTSLVVGGGAAYFARDRYIERRAVAGRETGLKLLNAGDYFHAMHSIGPYVRRHPNDAATLFAYARARQQVPESDRSNIRDAVSLLRRVMSLDPRNIPAAETLMKLYQSCRMTTELLKLSNDVLAMDGNNRTALQSRAVALFRLGDAAKIPVSPKGKSKDPALDAALAYNNLWPTDLEGQLLTLDILGNRDGSGKRSVARAAELQKQFPNDPRFILLQSIAQYGVIIDAQGHRDEKNATDYMTRLRTAEIPDVQMLQYTVDQFDRLRMFNDAYALLQRYPLKASDAEASSLLAGRLWQLKLYDQLVQRFPATVTDDGQTAALRCLALYELGRKDQAVEALGLLHKASEGNASAKIWAAIIEALHAGDVPDDAAVIASCRQALRENDNPYVQFILAAAYQRLGQTDDAVQDIQQVMYRVRAWSEPMLRMSELEIAGGNGSEALAYAQAALQRLPNDRQAMLCVATAKSMLLKPQDKAAAEAILSDLQKLTDEPKTMPLRVQILASVGRTDEAASMIRQALDPSAKTSAEALMQLALISRNQKLGLDDDCFNRCEKTYGVSPDLAFLKAEWEIAANRKDQGLSYFEASRAAASHDQLKWDITWCRLLELTGDGRAKDTWISLAEKNQKDIRFQWSALGANSIQRAIGSPLDAPLASAPTLGDRQSVRRILDRVKDDSLTWRIDQAIWLLGDQEKSEHEKSENSVQAALLLNEVTRSAPDMLPPKLLLAECLQNVNNVPGAIEQLIAAEQLIPHDAANLQPQWVPIPLRLADLLESTGDHERAKIYASHVLNSSAASLEQRQKAASIFAFQGDSAAVAAALDSLKRFYGAAINEPPADLVLAQLYRQAGQIDNAIKICDRRPKLENFNSIAFVAGLYDSVGRTADADIALKQLDNEKIAAKPGEKEFLLGSHALRTGDHAHAVEFFTAATHAAPTMPGIWRQLIRVQLMAGDANAAMAAMETARAADAALAKSPQPAGVKNSGFAAFARQVSVASNVMKYWPEVLPLTTSLLESPDEEPGVSATLKILPPDRPRLSPEILNKLCLLTPAHPKLLPLQMLTVRACLEDDRIADACAIASKSADAGHAEPAQFAAVTLANGQKWNEAIEMARQWRNASPANTLAADQFIAAAYIKLGNASAARDQLTPQITRVDAKSAKYPALMMEYAEIEARLGHSDASADLLRPHLAEGANWRVDWMRLAVSTLEPPQAASRLNEIESQSMKGDISERLAYAEAWEGLALRSKDAYSARASDVIERATIGMDKEALSPEAALSLGCLNEVSKDWAAAEKFYRKAIELNPEMAVAQNNLAMLLANRDEKLDEALALAQKAISYDTPDRAKFYDTLALVQQKRRDFNAGIKAIHQALAKRPNDPQYQIRLAAILADDNKIAEATVIFEQLKPLLTAADTSPDILKQLESLQQRLSGAKAKATQAS